MTSALCITYYWSLHSVLLTWPQISTVYSTDLRTVHYTILTCEFCNTFYWPLHSSIPTLDLFTLCCILQTSELCLTCYWPLNSVLHTSDLWTVYYILLTSAHCITYSWPLNSVTEFWPLHSVLHTPDYCTLCYRGREGRTKLYLGGLQHKLSSTYNVVLTALPWWFDNNYHVPGCRLRWSEGFPYTSNPDTPGV